MENPYQPPKSNLSVNTNEAVLQRKTVWKIFSAILITLYVLAIVLFHDLSNVFSEFGTIGVITDLIIYPIVLVGLFGYAWNKKILVSYFWNLIILVALVADADKWYNSYSMDTEHWITEFKSLFDMKRDQGLAYLKELLVRGFLVILMTIFPYIALYRYANQSPEIWSRRR